MKFRPGQVIAWGSGAERHVLPFLALLAVFWLDFLGISLPPREAGPLGDTRNKH